MLPIQETTIVLNYFEIGSKEVSGAAVSRLDYCMGDPGVFAAGAEFLTGIQF